MEQIIKDSLEESIEVKKKTLELCAEDIKEAATTLIEAIKDGKKLLTCGNGGSAADSQHFATELVVRYKEDRKSLPAISLTTDTSNLTACSNDYCFEDVFQRQINSLGQKGDVFVGISTSGNSKNVIKAIEEADKKRLKVISLTGKDGGEIARLNIGKTIIVPSNTTARIQETHIAIIHTLCELLDNSLEKETHSD